MQGIVYNRLMAEKELQTFREKWRKEIKEKVDHCRINKSDTLAVNSACNVTLGESVENISKEKNKLKPKHETCKKWNIAHDGRKRQRPEINQPNSLMTLEIPSYQEQQRHVQSDDSMKDTSKQRIECTSHHHHNEDLLSLLIKDIDETCAIPFFDISLPREVCINIFNYLDTADLCHCACVSKTWASIANDDLLWCKLYERLGLEKTKKNNVDDISWKCIVKNGILKRRLVERNWKERICEIQTFEYEKGGMLTACGLIEDVLIAGYANGKTCLWNVESNWQSSLAASVEAIQNQVMPVLNALQCLETFVLQHFHLFHPTLGYLGMINVWHTNISLEPIYQYHVVAAANHIALTSFNDAPLLLTLCGERVRVDHVNNNGQWQFVHSRTFEEKVRYIELLHDHERSLFALALKEEIFIYDAILNSPTQLDRIAGTKITSMTCVENLLAVGWAPYGFGLGTNFTAKVITTSLLLFLNFLMSNDCSIILPCSYTVIANVAVTCYISPMLRESNPETEECHFEK
ncbi:F-box/WD repeat-containing protein 8-like [Xenia sp. Carnegie-2017]|uniref:F-box/WD repeat-containing protein 8-like n=1 Tax=Xenia sp. Carnegie-2017 TaxID=2897299 RepID=UPI001F04BF42|nr:F-box/WD repeat-containing protein 8-like [Xenia sp. Carnegie-2017]